MTQFLQNLIDRHQQAGANKEAIAQVQPRPKSRFESLTEPASLAQNDSAGRDGLLQSSQLDLETGSNLTQSLPNTRLTTEFETNRSALDTRVTTQKNSESLVTPSDSSNKTKNLNEQIETLAMDKQLNSENLFVTGELNDRIQTIPSRLNNQQSPTIGNSKPVFQHDQTIDEIDKFPVNELQQHTNPVSETMSKFQQPNSKEEQQIIESSNKHSSANQTGVLQVPNWLSEIRTDLNNRMQQLQTQSTPEPVVNVTIGRVEVKAVQPNTVKQPKVRSKPSGVMSLDDYLKQRESRGRT